MKINWYQILTLGIIALILLFISFQPTISSHDLDYYFAGTLKDIVSSPLTWREFFGANGLGEYTVSTLWTWPIVFASSFLATLGLEYSLIIKLFFLLPIILLSYYGIKKLISIYGITSWPQTISILFYLLNTYILLLIDGGQLGLGLAYSLFPLSFLSFKNYIKNPKLSELILAIFYTLILSFSDIRIISLLVFMIVLDGIFDIYFSKEPQRILRYLKVGFITGIFLVGIHAYWLLPSINSRPPQLPINYDRTSQVEALSFATLTHALYLLQPHWYENNFGQIKPIRAEFVFIPILVFAAAILRRKNKDVAFWILVSLVSIFLVKGANEPFTNIYEGLFKYVPGFSLFRDPTKFIFLTALAFSILLGITSSEINQRLNRFPKIKILFFVLMSSYLLYLSSPIFLGKMTGLFSEPPFKKEYFQLADFLSSQSSFSRVLWIPGKASLGFTSAEHPALDGWRIVQKRPFAIGTKGTYETLNFLRESPFTGELLDVSGVGFIAYPFLDSRKDDMHPDNIRYYYTFLNQLSKLPWLSKVENSPIPLLKTKEYQSKFFVTPNVWWVIGSDNIYSEATKEAQLKLSKNALIFAEEYPGLSNRLESLSKVKIVLNNKKLLDLAASFIPSSELVFPAKQLDFEPNESGWWKRETSDLLRWRDFLQTKYKIDNQDFDFGGGWAIAEGNLKLKIGEQNFSGDKELKKGKILLARVLESSRSGELKFYQDEEEVGGLNTKGEGSNIHWYEVGVLKLDNTPITINADGLINVVNTLAIMDASEWTLLKEKSENLQSGNKIVSFNRINTEQSDAKIEFSQVDPTKYKIKISNLKNPGFFVFSENYDSLWEVDNQKTLPVYSLLNGFSIEKDGEYIVEFSAQKYVLVGLWISAITTLTLIGLVGILIKDKLKN